MYWISLLLMANTEMPSSCAFYRVKTAALWCAYVEIASYIEFRNGPRKENVGDPECMANASPSSSRKLGKLLMKSSSWNMTNWDG